MTPELLATVACHYDELEIRPIYSSSSISVKAFNLLSRKVENHSFPFSDLALAISPDHGGKIDAGYFTHGYDADSGPYKEWTEVEVDPEEFLKGAYGGHKDFKLSNELADIFKDRIVEGAHKLLTEKLSKGY